MLSMVRCNVRYQVFIRPIAVWKRRKKFPVPYGPGAAPGLRCQLGTHGASVTYFPSPGTLSERVWSGEQHNLTSHSDVRPCLCVRSHITIHSGIGTLWVRVSKNCLGRGGTIPLGGRELCQVLHNVWYPGGILRPWLAPGSTERAAGNREREHNQGALPRTIM